MTSPLLQRLTDELGWPSLETPEALDAYLARPGIHGLFVTGDPAKNLETNDAAVILPELMAATGGAFDCAVVAQTIERAVRERFEVWPTPSLILVAEGAALGAIPRVRDWDDYLARVRAILGGTAVAAE